MDVQLATAYEDEFLNRTVRGFRIGSLINWGKSAAVFRGRSQNDSTVAIKLFDRDLIRRFGQEQQAARLALEKAMGDNPHPNIVKVYDAGYDEALDIYFVAMEFIDAPNLESYLSDRASPMAPTDGIYVLRQLLGAARHLESIGLAHRDIKPSNIAISSGGAITLLDLGVLRSIGDPNGTDADGPNFVGTLRYSPPEFLLRTEEDSKDGWRAITIYQIAAVGHDVIVGRQLFSDMNPYGRLVKAVLDQVPEIRSNDYPPLLLNTLRLALSKDPRTRLRYANFDQLERSLTADETTATTIERIRMRRLANTIAQPPSSDEPQGLSVSRVLEQIEDILARLSSEDIPRFKVYRSNNNAVCAQVTDLAIFGLGTKLEITFSISIVNAADGFIEVAGCASQKANDSTVDLKFETNYVGILDLNPLKSWLTMALFDLIDQAQRNT